MIVEERITKDNQGLSRRLNALGLGINDFKVVDWNPMFVLIYYEQTEQQKKEMEEEQKKQRRAG